MVDFDTPASLLEEHAAIVGRAGAGKTFAAKVLVERLLTERRRVCIIDPIGVWHGLRSSADGLSPGFPVVIFGGDHADQPIGEHSGGKLAEILGTRNLPAIIDLSEFGMGERHRFMTDFAAELYRHNRLPLHVIIDEADEFIPQNPLPETRRMLSAVDRIVRRGRARGFRVIMITQRPAVIHKNVLSQAGSLIAMRLTAPQDRKAILDWVRGQADEAEGKAVIDTLAGLARGEGWIWSPGDTFLKRVQFPRIRTFDSSASPDYGDVAAEPMTLADVDTGEIAALLGDESAAADAPPTHQADPAELQRTRDAAFADGFRKGRAEGERVGRADGVARARGFMARAMEALDSEATITAGCVGKVNDVHFPDHDRGAENEHAAPEAKAAPAPKRATPVDLPAGDLPTSARKLLTELAARAPLAFSWTQIATLAGLKARGGSFNTGRKALRDGGLITEHGSLVKLSDAGIKLVGVDDGTRRKRRTPSEVVEDWCSKLPAPAPDMLRALVAAGPLDRVALGQRLGKAPRGGSFNTGIATLRRNGLVTEDGGRLTAAAELRG